MQLSLKLALIGVLIILLMLPMIGLYGLVHERMQRAEEVRQDIANASSRPQRLTGPIIVLDIEQRSAEDDWPDSQAADSTRYGPPETLRERRLLLPVESQSSHSLSTERRGRSLFSALVYRDRAEITARFKMPELDARHSRLRGICVAMGLGDNRGLDSVDLRWEVQALNPEPGTCVNWLSQGLQAVIPLQAFDSGHIEISAELALTGTSLMEWSPLGDDSRISISADWPHPSFQGSVLPREHHIDDQGFEASWRVSRLSSAAQQTALSCGADAQACHGLSSSSFSVALVEPVDNYRMSERAIKYVVLQLLLVFGTVFVLEALRGLSVHPMQYGLTGAALAVFFLLLLALSEHIGFGWAYLLAAVSCVCLISSYLGAVLCNSRLGWVSAVLLGTLYALLYGLLQSEDYALLMGALLLFAFLAAVMLGTRRVDWSAISTPQSAAKTTSPPS